MPRGVAVFLMWCSTRGIEIDDRLEIRESLADGSLSVFSKSDATIPIGDSLVRIPKSCVFSVKSCSRSRDIPAGKDDPTLELSLAFLLETHIGANSPWHGYFCSLPEDGVDIALFWGLNGDQDGVEAREWLDGTEAGKILSPPKGPKLLDRVDAYFATVAKGVLHRLRLPGTLKDFHRAYSIISSRAFLVDAYHRLSLVPVADAFDHMEDNHIHLESDYYVCAACGSLDQCEHDAESPVNSPEVACGEDTCEMVANLPIGPDEAVFNSYEKGLTNAELLCQYGFVLDVNESNLVTWSVDELLYDCANPEETRNLWRRLATQWPCNPGWDDVQLVFNPRMDRDDEDGVPTLKRANSTNLELNADGQISHQLWLFLFTLVRSGVDVGTNEALLEAQQAARAQERIEALSSQVTILDAGRPWTNECRDLYLVRIIAEKIIQICNAKIGSARYRLTASRIWELLDGMPVERRLTRLAISYALEERKMVQACLEAWSEFAECARSSEGSNTKPYICRDWLWTGYLDRYNINGEGAAIFHGDKTATAAEAAYAYAAGHIKVW